MREAKAVGRRQKAEWRLPRAVRLGLALFTSASCLLPSAFTQVAITFLPPPLDDSTLSMGIYDRKGKLVRVLHREAGEKEFTVGLNGYITKWDGRDDTGRAVPAGTYAARGFAVGAIGVEGMAIHGNDWIGDDDEAPRIASVADLRPRGLDGVEVVLKLTDGAERVETIAFMAPPPEAASFQTKIIEGKVQLVGGEETRDLPLGEGETALDAAPGAEGRVWIVVQTAVGTEVRQYAPDGEFLRRLSYTPGDPTPKRIVASRGNEQIVLLEESVQMQRVRSLIRSDESAPADPAAPAAEPASIWKTVIEKSIWRGENFDAVKSLLQRPGGKPFTPEKEFTVKLIDNELLNNEPSTARVNIGFNAKGSYLQTLDGLPLRRITETPNLKWAVIGREGSGRLLTILQSDGTAVEEFRASKLANMMMFDAGDYEWAGK
jgi:hypothetical protein